MAEALVQSGGPEAMQLRVAEQYIEEFGNLAKSGNTLVVPANLADLADLTGMIALATNIAKGRPASAGGA
ncbi:MAG TPA: band-7 C-terminal domain-containing protein [Woeseiaceae bacterium]|nr:band-7 C-terminal domain-containing protein [Woeseiaceae bacterium]